MRHRPVERVKYEFTKYVRVGVYVGATVTEEPLSPHSPGII